MLGDSTWSYTWEQGRQLAAMRGRDITWDFTYNSDGLRIGRTNGTDTYTYWYNDNGQLLRMKYNDIVMSFSYGASGQPMSITYNGTVYYYLINAQGDVEGLIDSSGNMVARYVYDAWGRLIRSTGTARETLGLHNPLRYRGYIYDYETGLYYLQSRYYNPTWGRFINADDPGYMGIDGTPSSYNLFAYCGNNPVTRADDDGEFWHIVIGAVVGLVTQYVSDVVAQCKEGKSFWEALKPKSSWVDYGAAALSGAVGATGIGFLGSIAANAGISGGQYLANCVIKGKTPNIDQLGYEMGFGALSGMIGGKGADGANLLGVYKTSKHILKTAVSPKKIAMYSAKCAEVRKKVIVGTVQSLMTGIHSGKIREKYDDFVSALW